MAVLVCINCTPFMCVGTKRSALKSKGSQSANAWLEDVHQREFGRRLFRQADDLDELGNRQDRPKSRLATLKIFNALLKPARPPFRRTARCVSSVRCMRSA